VRGEGATVSVGCAQTVSLSWEGADWPSQGATRSAPLYSKKLEGSVVCSVIRELTTDTRPTSLELSNPKL